MASTLEWLRFKSGMAAEWQRFKSGMTTNEEWQRFQSGMAVECQCLNFSALQSLFDPSLIGSDNPLGTAFTCKESLLRSQQQAEEGAVAVVDHSKPAACSDKEKIPTAFGAQFIPTDSDLQFMSSTLSGARTQTRDITPADYLFAPKQDEAVKEDEAVKDNEVVKKAQSKPVAGFDQAYYRENFSLAGVQETLERFPSESRSGATTSNAPSKQSPAPPAPLPQPPVATQAPLPAPKPVSESKDLPATGADLEIHLQKQEMEADKLSPATEATTEDTNEEWTGDNQKKKKRNRGKKNGGKGKGKGKGKGENWGWSESQSWGES